MDNIVPISRCILITKNGWELTKAVQFIAYSEYEINELKKLNPECNESFFWEREYAEIKSLSDFIPKDRESELFRHELLKYKKHIETLISIPKAKSQISYIWQKDADKEVPKLYERMHGKFINSSTTLNQFKAIFEGQPIENILPIKWHDDNVSELIYFNESLVDKVNSTWAIYKRMTACFFKHDGSKFKASFKELKQNILVDLSPIKQNAINELIKGLS